MTRVVAETRVEFFERNITVFVGIETSEDLCNHLFRSIFEVRNCGKFFEGEAAIVTSDLCELLSALVFDGSADCVTSFLTLFFGDFSVTIGVNFSTVCFTSGLAGFFDGLTLFFVNLAVSVDVIMVEEFWKGAVTE